MGRYAIIENGTVVNIAEADADFAISQGWIEADGFGIGDRYENGQFVAYDPATDPIATAAQAQSVRAQRNALLSACDWTQLDDAPVDRATWASYRQELRDLTKQTGFPWSVAWPVAP